MAETNAERIWKSATDPLALLGQLFDVRSHGSVAPQGRKSRMYLLACARRSWAKLPWVARTLVEVAERIVDGTEPCAALRDTAAAAAEQLTHIRGEPEEVEEIERELAKFGLVRPASEPLPNIDAPAWIGLAHLVYYPFSPETPTFRHIPATFHSARLVREVFGPRYGQLALFPWAWKTTTVKDLAQGMYDLRDFTRMPYLGDALLDAGCTNADVIDHCHHCKRHVRGCWVLDAILKK